MSDDETRVEAGGAQERPSGERQPPRALRPGDIVAHYRIVGPLGEGGSGAIYEARNIHHEGERVALKIVQPDIADRALFFDLLRAEASALQRVKHEAVVQYRTFGRLPDSDECFLVIEHVSGPTLAAAMRSAKLPEEAVRRLAIRLIDGLDAAHEQGIVHRDLSPDNVIMPDGDPDRATLIDFGIARSAAADPLGSKFAGKLSFAAPEQFADDPAQVGPWSDLYSLGLLLAAAARGRKLDMGSDLATAVALRRRIPNLDGVPPRLHGALAALLQPDPALRVRSASQAAALFAPQPQQSPVTVRDPERNSSPDAVAPQATVRRRRLLLIAAAIAAALGLGAAALRLSGPGAPPQEATPAPAADVAVPGPAAAASEPSPAPAMPTGEIAGAPPAEAMPSMDPTLDPRLADAVARAVRADAAATAFAEAASGDIARARAAAVEAEAAAREAESAAAKARAAARRACSGRAPPPGHGCYDTDSGGRYAGQAVCKAGQCTAEGFGVQTYADGSSREGRATAGGHLTLACEYVAGTRVYCGTLDDAVRIAGLTYLDAARTQAAVWTDTETAVGQVAVAAGAGELGGRTYTGIWRRGYLTGAAEVTTADGRTQIAAWTDGALSGAALTLASGGERQTADFAAAPPAGRIAFPSGAVYAGEVKDDGRLGVVAEGPGVLTGADGRIERQGVWRDGVLVEDFAAR